MSLRRLTYGDYKVGWICALHIELTAAMTMLDEVHHRLPPPNENDDNSYVLGSVGDHNVVIASLPEGETGTSSAAHVASQMRLSFTSIKFGLMVGIGGGVPSDRHDIRLGDVIVSRPSDTFGGVFQYDFGKSVPGGFKQTGFLNAPPRALRTAITTLRGQLSFPEYNKIPEYLSNVLPEFKYPITEADVLFMADNLHVQNAKTCAQCDRTKIVTRPGPPRNSNPVIHYGTIASGNQVMKDAVKRDFIAAEYGVLCFEMEAAGLMNSFPCVVIRGISDYADSHKNDRWKNYAAATAAAYAKQLLVSIPATNFVNTPSAASVLLSSTLATPTVPAASGSNPTSQESPIDRSMKGMLFWNGFLNLRRVALGRLIVNAKSPGQDYWPTSTDSLAFCLNPDDIDEANFDQVRQVIGEQKGNVLDKLANFLSGDKSRAATKFELVPAASKVYSLVQPILHFRRICKDKDTREWMENMRKYYPIFLIVGLVTVIDIAVLCQGSHNVAIDIYFVAPGERVIGIQYRKVKFRILSSSQLDKAHLEDNQWKLLGTDRAGSDDVLEADPECLPSINDLSLGSVGEDEFMYLS